MELLKEMRRRKVKVATMVTIKCNVYKDNSENTGKVAKFTSTDNPSST